MDVFCHRLVPQLLVFTLNQYLCYFAMNSAVGARQEAGTGTLRAVQGLWLFLSAGRRQGTAQYLCLLILLPANPKIWVTSYGAQAVSRYWVMVQGCPMGWSDPAKGAKMGTAFREDYSSVCITEFWLGSLGVNVG